MLRVTATCLHSLRRSSDKTDPNLDFNIFITEISASLRCVDLKYALNQKGTPLRKRKLIFFFPVMSKNMVDVALHLIARLFARL